MVILYKGIYVQECTYCEIMPLYIGTLKPVDIFFVDIFIT